MHLTHSKICLNRLWSDEIYKNCQFTGGGEKPGQQVYRTYTYVVPFGISFLWQTTQQTETKKKKNKTACNKNAYSPTQEKKKSLWATHPAGDILQAWNKLLLRKILHVVASTCGSCHNSTHTMLARVMPPWGIPLLISKKGTASTQNEGGEESERTQHWGECVIFGSSEHKRGSCGYLSRFQRTLVHEGKATSEPDSDTIFVNQKVKSQSGRQKHLFEIKK